jgi:flagellar basal body-associated protein FliL
MADPEVVDEAKGKARAKSAGKDAGGEEEGKAKKGGAAPAMGVVPILIAALVGIFLSVGGAFFLVKSLTPQEPAEEGIQPEAEAKVKETKARKPAEKKAAHGAEGSHGGSAAGSGAQGTLYTFDKPVIVNLAETNAERYFKVNLVLEMDGEALGAEIEERKPQIMDLLINILSNKTLENISTTSGRNMLRQEMIDKINALLETGRLVNIYFTEFVVQ